MLHVYDVSLDLIRCLVPVIRAINDHDPDLAKQMRRATASVPLNLAEGANARGARRTSHYSIAMGSAREALACIHTAEAFGYAVDVGPETHAMFQRILGTLYRVIRGHR